MSVLSGILKTFVGDKSKKDLKGLYPLVDKIHQATQVLSELSHDELRAKTLEFKQHIAEIRKPLYDEINEVKSRIEALSDVDEKESLYAEIDRITTQAHDEVAAYLDNILPEAFAVVKETAKRFKDNEQLVVTATPFDRTLSAIKSNVKIKSDKALWANSWDAVGKPVTWDMVHYDVQLVGGIVLHQGKIAEMQTGEGKTLVATLPVYLNALSGSGVTNNEFGFDYLRDNMAHAVDDLVQRPHNFAIVDEVDSVLVDDARTPLIISGSVPDGDRHEFQSLKPQISALVSQQRQHLTAVLAEAKKMISDGDSKEGGLLLLRVFRGLPKNKALIKFLSQEGARQLLQKTEAFYMQDNNREMHKVDVDLLFVIDEKNNQIELTDKGVEYLSKGDDDPNFFVLPDLGSQISVIEQKGLTLEEEAAEKEVLFKDYSIKSERIHSMNQLLKAYTLFEKDVAYVVMENQVKIVDEQTGRIMDGRRYSDGLHQAIEAKENVKIEAATQTFATITLQNYFRMYRKLAGMTGTAITEAGEFWEIYKLDVVEIPTNRPIARKDENDLIYKTKREKYNAVIDHVTSLSQEGRPVLIGTTSVEISELLSRMLTIRKVAHNVLNAKLHKKESDIVAEAGNAGIVTIATNMAGRGTDIKINDAVKEAGGLAIVGTERHDSRRVDRQLRGRSGRQGDPGSSQFYVSLEDNLMRLFGSERISKMMDRMGHKEGEVIQARMMTKSIERAQKKVEENNFGIRKRLLEYDDVMNAQREVIYKRRYNALNGERLQVDIANMLYETCDQICATNLANKDYKQFEFELIRLFSLTSPVTAADFESQSPEQLTESVYQAALAHYQKKMEENAKRVFPVIKDVYQNPSNTFKRIVVPFTDGVRTLNVVSDLEDAFESEGKNLVNDFEKNISLAIIDESWKDHLRKMDELKQSVQLAVHEQKDPLLIYKFESFELFSVFMDHVNRDIISFLFKGELPTQDPNTIREARATRRKERVRTSKEEVLNQDQQAMRHASQQSGAVSSEKVETVVRERPKIGRNERVDIQHVVSGERKTVKFKQAQPLLSKGEWVLIEDN